MRGEAHSVFLATARQEIGLPICADLTLNEAARPEEIRMDGIALGRMLASIAQRYGSGFAFPLMDLRLEKADLCQWLGIAEEQADSFHFSEAPPVTLVAELRACQQRPFTPHGQAGIDAIRYLAGHTQLLPVGMLIGPFSLATKLMQDPITAVALAAGGATTEESPEILLFDRCLDLATLTVMRAAAAQLAAGAKALVVCEPAASIAFLSPRQMARNPELIHRYVLGPNTNIRRMLDAYGASLIFHNCGLLTVDLIRLFASQLQPAMLSLGSSRRLWEDASVVSKEIVLYGNLPTRSFYSDADIPLEKAVSLARDLRLRMRETGHPHILGSECDVLYVPGAASAIQRKIDAAFSCSP